MKRKMPFDHMLRVVFAVRKDLSNDVELPPSERLGSPRSLISIEASLDHENWCFLEVK